MRTFLLSVWRRGARAGRPAVVVWFFVLISAPLVAFVAGVRPVQVENRTPVPAPELVPGRLLDSALYADVGDWFEDRLPGRDHAVEADAWIDYRVFGDSPSPRVSLGEDGWLFLTDTIRVPCITADRADEIAGELDLISRAGAAAGVEVVLVVAPDKAAIYPDRLGGLADEAACAAENRALLRSALSGSPVYVDTWAALRAAGQSRDLLLYHRTDTHWTRLGASEAAAAVVEHLEPGLWEPAAVVHSGTQRRHGDLVALMGLSFREQAATHRVWRGVSPDVTRIPTGAGPVAVVSETRGVPVVPGRAVLIHDSMGEVIVPLLRPYFEHLTSVRTRAASSFGIGGEWFTVVLDDADVLLLQTVEREIVGRFDGTVALRLVGALAHRLPGVEVGGAGVARTMDLPVSAAPRFLVVEGGGAASLQIGEVVVTSQAAGSAAVLDVTGLAGRAVVAAQTPPTRILLVTLP